MAPGHLWHKQLGAVWHLPSTLAALLLLYDHTLNCLLPGKQPPLDQPPLLLKVCSAHTLHKSFEHKKASF